MICADVTPDAEVMFISAKTGEGFDKWCNWLVKKAKEWKL